MKVTHEQGDPRSLTLLEDNARYMRHETFMRLVENVRKDGVLQQWPFVYHDKATGKRTVLSGNHRVKAAIEAGLEQIDWTECDEPLTLDKQKQIQLSHNAIVGEDDPEMLKRIYDSIGDVEDRLASGLDDAALELLFESSTTSLSEANLDFMTLAIVFLPDEYERAVKALEDAKRLAAADKVAMGRLAQHGRVLAALDDAREAAHVMNLATGLEVLLDVWDNHRTELRENWLDDTTDELKHKSAVPVTSVFGMTVEGETAKKWVKIVDKLTRSGKASNPGEALEVAAQILAENI